MARRNQNDIDALFPLEDDVLSEEELLGLPDPQIELPQPDTEFDVDVGAAQIEPEGVSNDPRAFEGIDAPNLGVDTQLRQPTLEPTAGDPLDPNNPFARNLAPQPGLGVGALDAPAPVGTAEQQIIQQGGDPEALQSALAAQAPPSPEEVAAARAQGEDAAVLEVPGVAPEFAQVEAQRNARLLGPSVDQRRRTAEQSQKAEQEAVANNQIVAEAKRVGAELSEEQRLALAGDWNTAQFELEDRARKIDELRSQAYSDTKPDNYWNNLGSARKVALFVGAFAGGVAQALFGTPNATLAAVENEIQRDIASQQTNQRTAERQLKGEELGREQIFEDLDRTTARRAMDANLKRANVIGLIDAKLAGNLDEATKLKFATLRQGLVDSMHNDRLAIDRESLKRQATRMQGSIQQSRLALSAQKKAGRGGSGKAKIDKGGLIHDPFSGKRLRLDPTLAGANDKTFVRGVLNQTNQRKRVQDAAQRYHVALRSAGRTFQLGAQTKLGSAEANEVKSSYAELQNAIKKAEDNGANFTGNEQKLNQQFIGGKPPSLVSGADVDSALNSLDGLVGGYRLQQESLYRQVTSDPWDSSSFRLRDVEKGGGTPKLERLTKQVGAVNLDDPRATLDAFSAFEKDLRADKNLVPTFQTPAPLEGRGPLEEDQRQGVPEVDEMFRRAKGVLREVAKAKAAPATSRLSLSELQTIEKRARKIVKEIDRRRVTAQGKFLKQFEKTSKKKQQQKKQVIQSPRKGSRF